MDQTVVLVTSTAYHGGSRLCGFAIDGKLFLPDTFVVEGDVQHSDIPIAGIELQSFGQGERGCLRK